MTNNEATQSPVTNTNHATQSLFHHAADVASITADNADALFLVSSRSDGSIYSNAVLLTNVEVRKHEIVGDLVELRYVRHELTIVRTTNHTFVPRCDVRNVRHINASDTRELDIIDMNADA